MAFYLKPGDCREIGLKALGNLNIVQSIRFSIDDHHLTLVCGMQKVYKIQILSFTIKLNIG